MATYDEEGIQEDDVSLLGIARAKRQRLLIATHYTPKSAGSRMKDLVQPMLESNRVKMLLEQGDLSAKSPIKAHRIQLASGEALYIKVECTQLIYILLTSRSFDPAIAGAMLTKTRELLIMKAEEKGVVDMEQYFSSGALNVEVMVTSSALEEIANGRNSSCLSETNPSTVDSPLSTPTAMKKRISTVAAQIDSVKDIMRGNISAALDNVVNPDYVETSIQSFEESASIFKQKGSKMTSHGHEVDRDACDSNHDIGDGNGTSTPPASMRQWLRSFGSSDYKPEDRGKTSTQSHGFFRSFSSSKSPTDVAVKKTSLWLGMSTPLSNGNVASDNFNDNDHDKLGAEEDDYDEGDNGDNVSVTSAKSKEKKSGDISLAPKSIRSKSPTVIKTSGSYKGTRSAVVEVDSSRSQSEKLNRLHPELASGDETASSYSDIHLHSASSDYYDGIGDYRTYKTEDIDNDDDDDDKGDNGDSDINEEFPMPAQTKSSKQKSSRKWYNFGSSKTQPISSNIVLKRADTSTALLQQQQRQKQQIQQKEPESPTPPLMVKSNSWSPSNDKGSEVDDDRVSYSEKRSAKISKLSNDRRLKVLNMSPKAGNFVFGLIWLGKIVDVEDDAFWTKKSKRTLLVRQSDAILAAQNTNRVTEVGKTSLMRSKSIDLASRDRGEEENAAASVAESTMHIQEITEQTRSKSVDSGNERSKSVVSPYSATMITVNKKVGFNSTEEEDEMERRNKAKGLKKEDNDLMRSKKLGVSNIVSTPTSVRSERQSSGNHDDDYDDIEYGDEYQNRIWKQNSVNTRDKPGGSQRNKKMRGRAMDVSEIEISELRAQAIAALRESHGDLADHLFPDENVLKEVVDNNEDYSPLKSRKSPVRHKNNNELRRENEKLRRLLEESINDLPPVPTQESILAQKKHEKEIQSLNLCIKNAGKEEREKAEVEIRTLKAEIRSLKETMREEKIKAEFAIDELLESAAQQVLALQESHDLRAAEEKGRMAMQEEMDVLRGELNALRQEKKQTSSQAEESIQLIMESSSSQIFNLQEALDRSQGSVEALTRFVRELLRRPSVSDDINSVDEDDDDFES